MPRAAFTANTVFIKFIFKKPVSRRTISGQNACIFILRFGYHKRIELWEEKTEIGR
jgi:hypothetical protein